MRGELRQGVDVSDDVVKPGKREWGSFWSLIGMQSTNAFNDNFTKFILIPLGIALTAGGQGFPFIEYILGGLLVLPFIVFAPTAGWLGDRFAKSSVIRWSSWLQLVVLLIMGGALWFGANYAEQYARVALITVMVAFFLLAIQSALLSPAKMGVVKELVGSEKLGFANGVMEGTVIIAILAGQVIGGVSFDTWGLQGGSGPWAAAMVPVLWVLLGAGLSIILSHRIQKTKAQKSERFSWAVATRHFHDLAKLKKDKAMWRCSLGIAFFWGFGGFLQFLLLQRAQEKMGSFGGLGSETALLWLPVVVGIAIGSVGASWICRRGNEMGLVVIGGLLMTGAMFLLGIASWPELWVRVLLALAGGGGALFLVPLNAFLQDHAAENERGLVLSASNLCINLSAVLALVFQFGLKAMGVPVWGQFLVVSAICGGVTISLMRLLPKDFIRLVFLGIFRSLYNVRAIGVENIPKEGGVLMVANHMTYIDVMVLSAACPRPIRFVMFADCFDHKAIGRFARLFDTVPISSNKARDGIRITAKALAEGAVVCLFAEGQLSRTGGLSEMKRGYQMMARRGGTAVLPTYMDGLWGSMWSFSEGNFLKKWPKKIRYGVSVAFGPVIPADGEIGAALRELSVLTVAEREKKFRARRRREPPLVCDSPRGWRWFLGKKSGGSRDDPRDWDEMKGRCWADDEAGRSMRTNALQLNQVHMAHRGMRLLVEWVPGDELSGILGILWPLSVGAKVSFADGVSDQEILAKVEAEGIEAVVLRGIIGREVLVGALVGKGVLIWSFDEVGLSDGKSFGCLVKNSRVVSFSRPNPDYETTTELPQSGWLEGKRGKLLPGWPQDEFGPIDEEGFLL
ncbi:MAG: acyl-[acyl-carrier-protein]-phospholipid O-acyltransferase [Akkermansiaceae bacterium]|jgi:acyl-[acyl-carrier-protein]-phospholipid O-acyltransferase/long-chain-fatty-acid--[acyl-carrier-protein] ligase